MRAWRLFFRALVPLTSAALSGVGAGRQLMGWVFWERQVICPTRISAFRKKNETSKDNLASWFGWVGACPAVNAACLSLLCPIDWLLFARLPFFHPQLALPIRCVAAKLEVMACSELASCSRYLSRLYFTHSLHPYNNSK